MDRLALRRLIQDIEARRVDCVVVRDALFQGGHGVACGI